MAKRCNDTDPWLEWARQLDPITEILEGLE